MAKAAIKNYDEINVRAKDVSAYRIFGWVRTKDKPQKVKNGKNAPNVVMKRKFPYGENADLARCEKKYFKLYKKKYRQLPILGILSFVLMLCFFAVTVFELYFGISAIAANSKTNDEDKPEEEISTEESLSLALYADETAEEDTDEATDEEETATESKGIKDILNEINDKYIAANLDPLFKDTVVYIVDESIIQTDEETGEEYVPAGSVISVEVKDESAEDTDEDEEESTEKTTVKEVEVTTDSVVKTDADGNKYITLEGTAKLFSVESLASSIGMEKYLTSEIFVGIVALILFVIFLIIFCEIAKIKKKRERKYATLADLEYEATNIIAYMRNRDNSLMSRSERKQAMWTNIIANGIRLANMNNQAYSDDDEDDDY